MLKSNQHSAISTLAFDIRRRRRKRWAERVCFGDWML